MRLNCRLSSLALRSVHGIYLRRNILKTTVFICFHCCLCETFLFYRTRHKASKDVHSAITFTVVVKFLHQLTITGEVIGFYGCEAGLWVLMLIVKWLNEIFFGWLTVHGAKRSSSDGLSEKYWPRMTNWNSQICACMCFSLCEVSPPLFTRMETLFKRLLIANILEE